MNLRIDEERIKRFERHLSNPLNCLDYQDLAIVISQKRDSDLTSALPGLLKKLYDKSFWQAILVLHVANEECLSATRETSFVKNLVGVEVLAPLKHEEWLNGLVQSKVYSELDCTLLSASDDFPNDEDGESCLLSCWIKAPNPRGRKQYDLLVEALLDVLLHDGRPLLRYQSTFLMPLDLFLTEDLANEDRPFCPNRSAESIDSILSRIGIANYRSGDACPSSRIEEVTVNLREPFSEAECTFTGVPSAEEDRNQLRQTASYFLPQIREMLFPSSGTSSTSGTDELPPLLRHWRLKREVIAEATLKVKVEKENEPQQTGYPVELEARVHDISLYHFYNNLLILAVRVEEAFDNPISDEPWWYNLIVANPKIPEKNWLAGQKRAQLWNWLRFNNLARVVRPTFNGQKAEEKIGKVDLVGLEVEGWKELNKTDPQDQTTPYLWQINVLLLFFPLPLTEASTMRKHIDQRLINCQDEDRMFVNTAYALAGRTPKSDSLAEKCLDRTYSFALYVDSLSFGFDAADGYYGDPRYLQKLLDRDSLDRWRCISGRSGFTCYSNVYFGMGFFFCQFVSRFHVPYTYNRLLVLVLFYQMALRYYSRRVSVATRSLGASSGYNESDFIELRRKFIEFTNCYWFRELTSQIQGVEIVDRMLVALDLDREYNLIKDEMERADEFIAGIRSRKYTILGGILTVSSVVLASLQLFSIFFSTKESDYLWTVPHTGRWALFFCVILVFVVSIGKALETIGIFDNSSASRRQKP